MHREPPLVLGVDAGGTKTQALISTVHEGGRCCVLGAATAGPGNPLSSGAQQACGSIATAVKHAYEAARLAPGDARVAVIAVAGAAVPDVMATMQNWANASGLAGEVVIVPDYAPLLALTQQAGHALGIIAGTGSVVFCRDSAGVVQRFGGWGHLLGDEGSGYALGRSLLRTVLQQVEQGEPPGLLGELVLHNLQVEHPREAIAACYRSADPRAAIAQLAAPLVHAAEQCDQAAALVAEETRRLAEVVHRAIRQADLPPATPAALAGGVLTGGPLVRGLLADCLAQRGWSFGSARVVTTPAEGCLTIASKRLNLW